MTIATMLSLGETALKLGLICSLTVLALFLSYSMLNVCDLSTDGCFTFGAAVGAVVAVSGHPFLSIIAAMAAGILSGFVTAILQTKLGVDSLLAGIIVNTALYSVNIAVMGGSSLINMNRTTTVFTMMKDTLAGTLLKGREDIIIAAIAVILVIIFLVFFLKTRLGLAIRATGNNSDMVKSSSINPVFTTVIGLCVANAFTALSGCLLSQSQKSVDINIGQGMVTIALASLLIGGTILGRGGIFVRAVGMVLGSFIFRLVYTIATMLSLGETALKLGLICSLTVLALFLSYSMLNVCDLSTDGCFTFGAAVGAVVAVSGHPFLSIIAAMAAGILSGFVTAILQTKLGVDSLLAGIIVNTALYSVNIAVMGGSSLINMNRTTTVFTMMKDTLAGTLLKGREDIIIAAIAVILVIIFLVFFLKTRLGLAIRATGNNSDMVKSSSINPVFTTVIGLCVANAFTALSGCLLSQSQKSVDINIGQGMVTIALASLLIGGTILGRGGIFVRAVGMVLGSFIFRLVYTIALRFNMPAFMLKLVSSVIVVLAISGPYLKKQWPQIRRRMTHTKGGR